ncbi:autophagy protein [Malassezia pachydermatis]
MSIAAPSRAREQVLSAQFNQDFSCVAVGTTAGYLIANCEPYAQVHAKLQGPTTLLRMLFSTSLVTLVSGPEARNQAADRRLQVLNTKRQSVICELSFPSRILDVHLNRRRLVVVLEDSLYVYDISNMKLLHTIETGPNPLAVCSLAATSDASYLAYAAQGAPSTAHDVDHGTRGHVLIYNLMTLSVAHVFEAHRSRIACVAMNASGTMLATASEKGTIIRVFSVPDGRPMYQFRRGSYAARIYQMTFNAANTLLCVTSDSGTVHIFRLTPTTKNDSPEAALEAKQRLSLFSQWRKQSTAMAGALGTYLPSTWQDMWEPSRDFAWLKLPSPSQRAVAAINNTLPIVMVLSHDGHLYTYDLDLERGGECRLTKTYALLHR